MVRINLTEKEICVPYTETKRDLLRIIDRHVVVGVNVSIAPTIIGPLVAWSTRPLGPFATALCIHTHTLSGVAFDLDTQEGLNAVVVFLTIMNVFTVQVPVPCVSLHLVI